MSSATVGANLAPHQHHPYPHQQPRTNSTTQNHASFSANVGPPHPPPSDQGPAMPAPAPAPSPVPGSAQVLSPPAPAPATATSTMTTTPVPTPTQTPVPAHPTLAPAPYHQHPQHPPHHHPSPQPPSVPSSSAPMQSTASQQSFGMSQPTQSLMAAPPSYRRSFSEMSSRFANDGPGIYSAVYSGVDVYEMEVNNVAVMRRRADSWLNATQILKVAGVDKGKRTKILEKEIQTGEHEKVQGGYGKYQGTWIKFERGVEVCQQYGVEELLRPLLTYDMGQDGGIAGRGDINTPTKEQAMAAQRKRTMYASQEAKQSGMASTFFKSISTTASQAVAAMSKGRFDPSGMRNRVPSQPPPPRPSFSRQSSMQNLDDVPPNSQQSVMTDYSGVEAPPYGPPSHVSGAVDEPPRKRQRMVTPAGSFSYAPHGADSYAPGTFPPPSPTEPNESFYQPNGTNGELVASGQSVPPLQFEVTAEAENARQQMVHLFIGPDTVTDDILAKLSPAQIDMPIDALCNNALHYAATLARVRILSILVSLGGNVWRVNADGDTPLMRVVMVTNSLDSNLFPDLLEIIGCTLDTRDNKGRTVLHKIALASGLKGRANSSKYYLESLLEWVVRSGSQQSSQMAPASSQQSQSQNMNLARFINEIVDAQDHGGDTALMIAARIGNKSIISQLLEVGADPTIANRVGLKPTTFGVGTPSDKAASDNGNHPQNDANGASGSSQKSRETNEDIMTYLSSVVNESFATSQQELKTKQESINSVHSALESASSQLAEARRKFESLQAKVRKQKLDRQKITNLSQARHNFQNSLEQDPAQSPAASDPNSPPPISAWETQLSALLEAAGASSSPSSAAAMLPPTHVLRARIKAVSGRRDDTNHMATAMRGRSRDTEDKYRKLVSLCSNVRESEVDADLDGLLKAVESEVGDLEIGRVRRFLGSVEETQ